MSHAGIVALRLARRLLSAPPCHPPLRPRVPGPRSSACPLRLNPSPTWNLAVATQPFSHSVRWRFRQSTVAQKLKPYGSRKKPEKGLRFRPDELAEQEIRHIFGSRPPPAAFANHLLRVLHGRRVDGTLDLALPAAVEAELDAYPHAVGDGLLWLRAAYPVDEDAAILARIEREEHAWERDNPAELIQRGQELGLYRGPQSGHYHAALSDKEGDVYGVSELEKLRAESEARAAREEEELQAQIDHKIAQAQQQQRQQVQSQGLVQRPDQEAAQPLARRSERGLDTAREVRPPNSVERWVLKAKNRAESKLTLASPEIAQQTAARRLWPSLVCVSLLCGASYLFARAWTRPQRADRLWPDVSLSFATVGALVAANVAVFVAWRLPPLWRVLNKYFIIVPAYPYALSMLGSLFSHQKFTHLGANMLTLVLFGLPLHEDVGRGPFLAIYLAAGLLGGFGSLAQHTAQKILVTSSLGASGCVYGVVAAYLTLHADDQFSLIFLPPDLAQTLSFSGQSLLACLAVYQVVGIFRPLKKIDYVDHLIGIGVGAAAASWWRSHPPDPSTPSRPSRTTKWWHALPGSSRQTDK